MEIIQYGDKKITYKIQKKKIKNLYIQIKNVEVIVKAPNKMKEKNIQEIVQKKAKWLKETLEKEQQKPKEEPITPQKLENLKSTVQMAIKKYANYLKVYPNKIRIKDIKYAWGSCSSNRNITINAKLANKSKEAIEYVVLHELCHLKEMNHSTKFWNLVEYCMSDYKIYRKELR